MDKKILIVDDSAFMPHALVWNPISWASYQWMFSKKDIWNPKTSMMGC
jgi:hypothetical protein